MTATAGPEETLGDMSLNNASHFEISLVSPMGDPHRQIRALVEGNMLGVRYIFLDVERHGAFTDVFIDSMDEFMGGRQYCQTYQNRLPLGIITISTDELHVVRRYYRQRNTGNSRPRVPIVRIDPMEMSPDDLIHSLVYGKNGVGIAANKYILLHAQYTSIKEVLRWEELVERINAEVFCHEAKCPRSLSCPLGMFIYNSNILACWENYPHTASYRA